MADTKSSKSTSSKQVSDGSQDGQADQFAPEASSYKLTFAGGDVEAVANRDSTGLSDWQITGWEPARGQEPVILAQVTNSVMERLLDAASDSEPLSPPEVEDAEAAHAEAEELATMGSDSKHSAAEIEKAQAERREERSKA